MKILKVWYENEDGNFEFVDLPYTINSLLAINSDGEMVGANNIEVDNDIVFSSSLEGIVLKDRTTGTKYRLYIDNGVLGYEQVT